MDDARCSPGPVPTDRCFPLVPDRDDDACKGRRTHPNPGFQPHLKPGASLVFLHCRNLCAHSTLSDVYILPQFQISTSYSRRLYTPRLVQRFVFSSASQPANQPTSKQASDAEYNAIPYSRPPTTTSHCYTSQRKGHPLHPYSGVVNFKRRLGSGKRRGGLNAPL